MTIDAKADYFTDPSIIQDPFPYYEAVREHGPVWREPHHGAFVVTGYEEISEVVRRPELFSSCNSFGGPFPGLPEEPEGDDASELIERCRHQFPNHESFITWDPPLHTKHRALLAPLLTPKRLRENEEFMRQLADEQIDAFIERGSCEFVGEYAQPLAMLVIADLLGIPKEDHAELRAAFVAHGTPGAKPPEGTNFLDFLERWFLRYIEDRRREPRDDALTKLALSPFPDGSMPEVIDAVRVGTLLFAGGQGTAARYLTNAMKMLAEEPGLQQQLRDDPDGIPTFVEEMLRFGSPVKTNFRMARQSTTLDGIDIPAGSVLILLLGAANRDPRQFDCPAEFHADRANARQNIAFGKGVHFCPGAPLVRSEAPITVSRMLDRLADIRISEGHHGPPGDRKYERTPSYILTGVEALHLEFTPIG